MALIEQMIRLIQKALKQIDSTSEVVLSRWDIGVRSENDQREVQIGRGNSSAELIILDQIIACI